MTDAPTFPARQSWAEAMSLPFAELVSIATPLLRKDEPVAFVGGKLAAALMTPLQVAGFPAVVSDRRHPILADIPPDAAEYEAYGHGYGEVHTAREFRQLVERAARTFTPAEDRWREDGRIVDPFRPGLRYAAVTDQEFDVLQERHLNAVRTAVRRTRTLIVSLSHSEVWESKADGAVYPGWTTAAERHFDPERHAVRTLTVEETVLDLLAAVKAIRGLNPSATIVLMVSPEPQTATTHPAHVQVTGAVGKAILRIAMEAVAGTEGVAYFPALEIAQLTAPASAYGPDGSVPAAVIDAIAQALVAIGEGGAAAFTAEATPITVFRTMPAEPRPVRKPRTAAPSVADALAGRPAAAAEKMQTKPKPLAVSVVDPYSEIKTAEAKARAERRAAHYAAIGQTPPPDDEPEAPSLNYSERQVMKREKALAREARLAAAAAISPEQAAASAEARRKREEARAAAAAAAASQAQPGADDTKPGRKRGAAASALDAAPSDAEAKARRKEKRARVKAAGSEAPAQADVQTPGERREKKRAAKG